MEVGDGNGSEEVSEYGDDDENDSNDDDSGNDTAGSDVEWDAGSRRHAPQRRQPRRGQPVPAPLQPDTFVKVVLKGKPRWECTRCADGARKQSGTAALHRDHLREAHNGAVDCTFIACDHCGAVETSEIMLKQHLTREKCTREFPNPSPHLRKWRAREEARAAEQQQQAGGAPLETEEERELLVWAREQLQRHQPTMRSTHLAARNHLRRLSCRLIDRMATLGPGTVADLHLAALLLLPALAQRVFLGTDRKERQKKVNKLLEGLAAAAVPQLHVAVLTKAKVLLDQERLAERSGASQAQNNPGFDALAARVEAMVAKGNMSAGLGLLQDEVDGIQPLPQMTAEVIRQKLQEKDLFPEATDADHVSPSEQMEEPPVALQVTREHVTKAFEKLKVGSASGQSGWSAKLLQVLSTDSDKEEGVDGFVTSIVTFFNLLLRGELHCAEMMTVCRLALLPKPDGGIRPIAIGDSLLRALGATVTGAVREQAAAVLAPHQFGVGVRGGVDQVVGYMNLAMNRLRRAGDGKYCVVATDIKNAFGTMARGAMAEAVRKHLPQLYRLYELLYGSPSQLVTRDGERVATISTGGRQGDNLMSLFFCLALKDPLERVAAAHPGVPLFFFMDDGNIEGDMDRVMPAVQMLASELAKMGLIFHGGKSKFFCGTAGLGGLPGVGEPYTRDADEEQHLVELTLTRADGVKILGAPLGTSTYVDGVVSDTLERYGSVLERLSSLSPDVAVAIAHTAVNQRPMQLTRQLQPDMMESHLHGFDTRMDDCLARVLKLGAGGLPQHAKVLRGLPTYMAGLGIPRLGLISKSAHTACVTQAMVAAERLTPLHSNRIRSFYEELTPQQVRLFTDILPIFKVTTRNGEGGEEVRFAPPFGNNGVHAGAHAADVPALDVDHDHPRLQDRGGRVIYDQRVLTQKAYAEAHGALLERLTGEGSWQRAAMVRSTEALRPLHSWVLSALSPLQHLRLSRVDYVDAVRHRLLIPDFDGNNGQRRYCACQREALRIDEEGHQLHLLACTASAVARQRTHDCLVDATAAFAKQIVGGENVRTEQTLQHGDRPVIRMDIVITRPDGQQLLVDVGHTSPAGRFAVPSRPGDQLGAAYVHRRAAAEYEAHKRRRAGQSLPVEAVGRFYPMIFETTGCLGVAATELLKVIAGTNVHPAVCDDRAARARRHFLRRAGVILARGIAGCIQAVRADSRAEEFEEEDWARLGALDAAAYRGLPDNFDQEGGAPAAPAEEAGPLHGAEGGEGDDPGAPLGAN